MAHIIQLARVAADHLRGLRAHERAAVLTAIEEQLQFEPLTESRNRKPLRPNPLAPWELRVGELRVFYDITSALPSVVNVLAIGRKEGNVLRISGKEIKL